MTKKTEVKSIQDFLRNMPVSDAPTLSAEELMQQAVEISKQAAIRLAEERKKISAQNLTKLVGRSAIPARYREAKIKPVSQQQAEAYAKGAAFAKSFRERLKTGGGMVLWGDVGTGKTHLACGIANALMSRNHSALYCTALEAVMLIKATFKQGRDGMSEYDVYARFGEPELLIIDEIGVQSRTEFEQMVLTSIADIRSRNCLPTIIISNLEPKEIYALLGERMFDRLVGFGAEVIHMPGKSLRLRGIQ